MTPQEVIQALTPFVVLGITQLVRKYKASLPGWSIMAIVTLLSAGLAWVADALVPGLSWLIQFGLGLLSIVLHQLKVQIQQGNDGSPGYQARVIEKKPIL